MNKKFVFMLTLFFSFFLLFQQPIQAKAALEDRVVSANPGDSTAKLQTLLDTNKNGEYNLTIQIPAGRYELKNELIIYSNTTILADANARFNKNHQKGAMITNDLTYDKGGYDTAVNITIKGGIWDSSLIAGKNKGTESFRFIHGTNITIKDATISNVPENSHLITFAGVKDSVIDNCKLYGYVGTNPKEAIQLDIVHDSVRVPSMQASSIRYDDLPCDGIKITNNEIYDFPRAIGSHTSIKGVFHKNVEISKNTLHDITEAAIKLYNYQNATVDDNVIYNAGVGVLAYTYLGNQQNHYLNALKRTKKEPLPTDYNIEIKNNRISNISALKSGSNASWGQAIRTIGCKTRPLSGVLVENNTIINTDQQGILMQRSPNCTVKNNTLKATSNTGIYLIYGSNYTEVTDNILTQTGNSTSSPSGGIGLFQSTDALVSKNTITSPGKDGIFLLDKSKTCSITENTISSAKNSAIAVYDQSNESTLTDNEIKDYYNYGIYTSKISSAIIKTNNIYGKYGVSKDGININGNNASKSNFTLEENYIKTATRYGIYISNAPKSYVGSNTILDITKNAIYLDQGSDGSKIYYNIITYADNTITRYNRIKTINCKAVLRYENIIYKV